MITKKNLLVFDIDGTLTDTVAIHQQAFIQALQALDIQSFNAAFGTYQHHTDSHIAKVIYESAMGQPFTPSLLERFEATLYEEIEQATIKEIKGGKKLVEKLEQHPDFGICFATGSLYKPALLKLERVGIAFDPLQLVASNQIEERENIVTQAINNAKTHYQTSHFDRIISIGDGLWDLITAQNLNLDFIGIGTTNQDVLIAHGMQCHFIDLTNFEV